MRRRIVRICVLVALVALVGLRLFGFWGEGAGYPGVEGDPVRFCAAPLAVRLLKGTPDEVYPLGDTPMERWRYEGQSAFGRDCSIEYTLYRGEDIIDVLILNGVMDVDVDIPVDGEEDGRQLADEVYQKMLSTYARKGFSLIERDWAPSTRANAIEEAGVSFTHSAVGQDFEIARYADRLRISVHSQF